jgi:hypothetical protein
MHRICLLFVGILISLSGESQRFDYSFGKDSVSWQELNNQTILNSNNSAWDFCYKIPIGFSFNYLGAHFDSVRIETNGYLVFDENRNYALTTFLGFGDCRDEHGNHSVLGYELSGNNGNHVLKIQFKNTGVTRQSSQHFSYQIWLRENGLVEVHVGPNDFQPGMVVDTIMYNNQIVESDTILINYDSLEFYRVGLINMNMNATTNGFFIGGTVSSPQSQPVDENHPDPIYMMCAPSKGTRYTFTPNFN